MTPSKQIMGQVVLLRVDLADKANGVSHLRIHCGFVDSFIDKPHVTRPNVLMLKNTVMITLCMFSNIS